MDSRAKNAALFFSNPELYLRGNYRVSLRAQIVGELLGEVGDCRILDLGCGDGRISAQFLPARNQLTLLDISDRMLERAKEIIPKEYAPQVAYVNSDILGFTAAAPYDIVLCLGVLAHVSSIESVVAKVASLVKPGGRCIFQISDYSQFFNKFALCVQSLRRFVNPSNLDYKVMTMTEVLSVTSRHGLSLRGMRRHLLLLFPGMARLLGRWLIPYDLFTSSRPLLSRFSCDVILMCVKEEMS